MLIRVQSTEIQLQINPGKIVPNYCSNNLRFISNKLRCMRNVISLRKKVKRYLLNYLVSIPTFL